MMNITNADTSEQDTGDYWMVLRVWKWCESNTLAFTVTISQPAWTPPGHFGVCTVIKTPNEGKLVWRNGWHLQAFCGASQTVDCATALMTLGQQASWFYWEALWFTAVSMPKLKQNWCNISIKNRESLQSLSVIHGQKTSPDDIINLSVNTLMSTAGRQYSVFVDTTFAVSTSTV